MTNGGINLDRLRADYKEAFDEWALQITRLQTLSQSDPQGLVTKEAEHRVAAAENAYRDSRDRLTDDMVSDIELPAE
jgi:hypothetical protein